MTIENLQDFERFVELCVKHKVRTATVDGVSVELHPAAIMPPMRVEPAEPDPVVRRPGKGLILPGRARPRGNG